MPTIHTKLPVHPGENKVSQRLNSYTNPKLELWFNINYIAGVPEIDLIVFEPKVGYYQIEIKSMRLTDIQKFTQKEFVLQGDVVKTHPTNQLRSGNLSLQRLFQRSIPGKEKNRVPFVQATVLWSEITRKDWRERFSGREMKDYETMCMFKDDLESEDEFMWALRKIWEKPILGTHVPLDCRKEHGNIDEFRKALEPSTYEVKLAPSMKVEISKPVPVSRQIANKYELGQRNEVSIQGAPGTGKTTILREIGLRYLSAGAMVLHICFNKVLAADQKREYQLLRQQVEDYGVIDVYDIWQFYKELGHVGGIKTKNNLLENVQKFLASDEGQTVMKYDAILVDESQDLDDSFFQVLELLARPTTSWFVAYGKGQEINNFSAEAEHPSPWLKEFLARADANHLRRSFRNSTKAFLLAQSFWEKFPEIEAAKTWLKEKFGQSSNPDNQFELDLQVPQNKNDFKLEVLPGGARRKAFIKGVVVNALEDARQTARGEDLLVGVLAPSRKTSTAPAEERVTSYELVREVLEEVAKDFELDFNDLVPSEARRDVPKIGAIRLVTLQGIRGLSASHVIIFDLLQLEKWVGTEGESIKPPLVNLTYIALSRSKASTILVMEDMEDSVIEPFLTELSLYATELSIKQGKKP